MVGFDQEGKIGEGIACRIEIMDLFDSAQGMLRVVKRSGKRVPGASRCGLGGKRGGRRH